MSHSRDDDDGESDEDIYDSTKITHYMSGIVQHRTVGKHYLISFFKQPDHLVQLIPSFYK